MAERGNRLLSGLDRLWFSGAGAALRSAAHQTADLVAPTWCVGCRASGTDLCADCHHDLRLLMRRPFRAEGGAQALPVLGADRTGVDVLPVISAASYRTLVADVVVAFKDHERVRLSRVLAPALAGAVRVAAAAVLPRPEALLIWPPASPRARLRRGRSPLQELLGDAETGQALPAGITPAGHLLRHSGSVLEARPGRSGQKGRSKVLRRKAMSQFSLAPGSQPQLQGADVLLVDDVLTTGATLHGLYGLLAAAGAAVHGAAVLAAAPQAEPFRGVTPAQR